MKRIVVFCLSAVLLFPHTVLAADLDFSNMTLAELNAVREAVENEIQNNHSASSSERSSVEECTKAYIEQTYGSDNVDWAWIDYTYTKDWDFFTLTTHADITKSDGGTAEYGIYSEVYSDNGSYTLAYVQVGNEVLLDNRNQVIRDEKVLRALGMDAPSEKDVESMETSPEAPGSEESAQDNPVLARNGDSGATVSEVQSALIRLGYLSGGADGIFGGGTEAAVMTFQSECGLPADGIVTKQTYDLLISKASALPEVEEVLTISAVDLYNQFDNNSLGAESTYKDKYIYVTGTIGSIGEDILGAPYVCLNADAYGWTSVQCYFARNEKDLLVGLNTGDSVTIKGTNPEMVIVNVVLEKCSIVG